MPDRNLITNTINQGDIEIHFARRVDNYKNKPSYAQIESVGVFKNNTYLQSFFQGQNYIDDVQHEINPRLLDTLKNFIATDMGDRLLKGLDISYLQGIYDGVNYVRNKLQNDDTVYYHLFTD